MLEMTIILTVAGAFLSNKSQLYTYESVKNLFSKSESVENFFFRTSSSTEQFGFKPRMPLSSLGPADERHQSLFMAEKKRNMPNTF